MSSIKGMFSIYRYKSILNKNHCKLMSNTGATLKQLDQAVQYPYRLYKPKRVGTPNVSAPSREVIVQW